MIRKQIFKILITGAGFSLLFPVFRTASGQTLDVVFRYVKRPGDQFVRVFVPGTMPPGTQLDWGPNTNGFISPSAPSLMTYDPDVDAYVKTYTLDVGQRYEYKFHFHYNEAGTQWEWITDPLNNNVVGTPPFDNSYVDVTDPLIFQPALHENDLQQVTGMSVGIFTTLSIDSVVCVAGQDTFDGRPFLRSDGVLYVPFTEPKSPFAGFRISVTIQGQEIVALERKAIQIVKASRPYGTRAGVNLSDSGAVFVLYAPGRPVVQLLLAPEGQPLNIQEARTMKKALGEDGVWWLDVALSPGRYVYQYLFLDGTRISDPLSRYVVNGQTVFEVGPGGISTADDFEWSDQDFVRPALDTLVIYELHVDDFAAQGSGRGRFFHVIQKLDYLDSLGINAIELMPIMEFPGDRSWGYNTSHYAAVEATYGTPREFKELVNEAHRRGIAVILDIVWNHMSGSGPLWKMQPNYEQNPFFKAEQDLRPNETRGTFGGVDWDHFTPQTQAFVNEIHRIWIEEYHVDGFRFDFTRGIGWDLSRPQYGILGWSSWLKKHYPGIYQIAEHLPADPRLISISSLDAGWNDSFHDMLLKDIHGPAPSLSVISALVLGLHEYNPNTAGYEDRTQTVKACVTHDEQSLIQEMVRFKGIPQETALRRDLLYNAMLFTSLGIPMIWQAQEMGMQSGWFDDNHNGNWDEEKLAYRPVDWSLLSTERGKRHFRAFRKWITLRKKNPALYRGEFYVIQRFDSERVLVYGYRDESAGSKGDAVVVVANLSSTDRRLSAVRWLESGRWKEILSDSVVTVEGDSLRDLTIPAYTALIFARQIGTEVADGKIRATPPVEFSVWPAFPNPFNSETVLVFQLPESAPVTVQVFDAKGHRVFATNLGRKSAGRHRFVWQTPPLASGVYFVRFQAGRYSGTRKVILLK